MPSRTFDWKSTAEGYERRRYLCVWRTNDRPSVTCHFSCFRHHHSQHTPWLRHSGGRRWWFCYHLATVLHLWSAAARRCRWWKCLCHRAGTVSFPRQYI